MDDAYFDWFLCCIMYNRWAIDLCASVRKVDFKKLFCLFPFVDSFLYL